MPRANRETNAIPVYPVCEQSSLNANTFNPLNILSRPQQSGDFIMYARVAELVDAVDLKSIACKGVRVRVPLLVP